MGVDAARSELQIHAPPSVGTTRKCILLGGLSDGLIPTSYTKLLEDKCHSMGYSLVQPILSSSYLGFGHGSLFRDTDELTRLMDYLVEHHTAVTFALVGHSTGCQNSVHFLKNGRKDLVEKVKAVALQAPVSDRESITLLPGEGEQHAPTNIAHARSLLSSGNGEEMMPRGAFWAPITASRYLSLFDVDGDDDYFSSDLTNDELHDRLGHVGTIGRETGMHVLVAYSKLDEYVPKSVNKDMLLRRIVSAMNGEGGEDVANGCMLQNANHSLSNHDGDKDEFVQAFGELLEVG